MLSSFGPPHLAMRSFPHNILLLFLHHPFARNSSPPFSQTLGFAPAPNSQRNTRSELSTRQFFLAYTSALLPRSILRCPSASFDAAIEISSDNQSPPLFLSESSYALLSRGMSYSPPNASAHPSSLSLPYNQGSPYSPAGLRRPSSPPQ